MKMKIHNKWLLPAIAVITVIGCSKKIDEAYLNPNAETVKPIEQLLPGLIDNMTCSYTPAAGTNYGTTNDGLYFGKYIQFWTTNTANNQYDLMGGAIGGSDLLGSVWAMHYYGQGQNLNRVVEWGTEQQKWDYVGVAHAIRAWGWLTLTSVYGEAILKEAFNTSQRVFNYDSQEEIYGEVRRVAHLALENLNRTDGNVSKENLAIGDKLFYQGDVEKWKKFVYAILARSFNHLSNKADYKPDSVVKYCDLAINDNVDNAYARFTNAGPVGTYHFWGPQRSNFGAQRQTDFIANLMTGQNETFNGVMDPRAWYILQPNPNGTFTGLRIAQSATPLAVNDRPNGFWGQRFDSTVAPANDSRAKYVFRNGPLFPIITAAEVQFMKAEALYHKSEKAAALAAYEKGIELSMNMLATDFATNVPSDKLLTPSMISDYLNEPTVVPVVADFNLSHIMMQKYIAMYGYGVIETWVDMRRYNYTDPEEGTSRQVYTGFELPSSYYVNNLGEPVYRARPRYNSEYLYNIEALQKVGGLDLNYHTKKMWFSEP